MKKSILITTLAVFSFPLLGLAAQNYDRREDSRPRAREDYRQSSDYRQLRAELDQLNRMFVHVSANLHSYRVGGQIRRDYSRLLRDKDRLNFDLQSRTASLPRIHAQIDRIRDQLREIEVQLRVRRYYHWR